MGQKGFGIPANQALLCGLKTQLTPNICLNNTRRGAIIGQINKGAIG
jgi:hypothetical protein